MGIDYGCNNLAILAAAFRPVKRTIPIWWAEVAVCGAEEGSMESAGAECERWYYPSHYGPVVKGNNVAEYARDRLVEDLDGPLQAELNVR